MTGYAGKSPVNVVARIASRIGRLDGWARAGCAFAAGVFSLLSFAPFHFMPVMFVTLPIMVWLIDGAGSVRRAAKDGWFFGFGFFVAGLYWIGEAFLVEADKFAWLLPFAVTLLPAGMALFWSAAAGLARRFWSSGLSRLVVFVFWFSLAEWLRGHILSGLPWNLIGYALTVPDVLMQSASLFGVYGLTTLALALFVLPAMLLADLRFSTGVRMLCASLSVLGPLGLMYAFGTYQLSAPTEFVDGVQLRLVQPSVPQREKWLPEYQQQIFQDHLDLSRQSEMQQQDDLAGVTHLFWPEAAMPFLPLEHPEALKAIGELLPDQAILVTGALRRDAFDEQGNRLPLPAHRIFNGVMVFNTSGQLSAHYDKIHLVPFGEYLPMSSVLESIGLKKLTHGHGAFTPGALPRKNLQVPGLVNALPLVCYEAIFPGAVVQQDKQPELLINLTNDGWFGTSVGPYQHFHQARLRAVEEGVPMVRVANNGISAVVNGRGQVLQSLGLDQKGVIDSILPAVPRARIGLTGKQQYWLWLVLTLTIGVIGSLPKIRKKHSYKENSI